MRNYNKCKLNDNTTIKTIDNDILSFIFVILLVFLMGISPLFYLLRNDDSRNSALNLISDDMRSNKKLAYLIHNSGLDILDSCSDLNDNIYSLDDYKLKVLANCKKIGLIINASDLTQVDNVIKYYDDSFEYSGQQIADDSQQRINEIKHQDKINKLNNLVVESFDLTNDKLADFKFK